VKTQASTTLFRGPRTLRIGGAVFLALLPLVSASARLHHSDAWARQQFSKAEQLREALNGRPVDERTRREYQRVIDSYRRVYFGAPTSSKADPSVVATAELMVEMGRRFDDNKILSNAVDQYRFLRKEYPGSKYRFDALFTIGEIYKDDLDDPEQARAAFGDFLHRYPRNHLADDARAALKELDADAAAREKDRKASKAQDDDAPTTTAERSSTLPRVTGVRYWSTPDYTRVAIDVEQEIKYDSQRISNPDRIFFDLRDTKLASTLVGKTFDVDDGFLRKVRVAQFKPGRARIVLEVDDLASYEAFLLPNPYRLIIDIHGKQKRATLMASAHVGGNSSSNAAAGTEDDSDSEDSAADSPGDSKSPGSAKKKSVPDTASSSKSKRIKSGEDDKGAANGPDPAQPVPGIGVIKTQVTVDGKRKIPKTIIEADDQVPTTVATLEAEKIGPAPASDRTVPAAEKAGGDTSAKEVKATKTQPRTTRGRKSQKSIPAAPDTADLQVREAQPTATGDRSLIRALGLKIGKIVIDAGHGGHDTGTIGPNGLLEKDLVLDVSKRLGRLLESRLGAEVVYTRRDDTFIPLETRTAIANRERADLFISIHANSSHDPDARGVETYYLNFTSSPEALEVAARENAVSEKSIYELQDLVKKIALKEKIEESREFASNVQDSLYGGLSLRTAGVKNRGVKKAPFIVLIGANMPSILAEISFVSNPTDERKLATAEQRQRIAESLYRGVSRYAGGLSGVKVASKIDKDVGQ